MVMSEFKEAATHQLGLLGVALLLACATEAYARVGRAQCYILGMVFAAAMLLFTALTKVNMAEAKSGADATVKGIRGIASVAAGWGRAALRGMFLLAVGLSAAAYFLVVGAFEDGYRYRTACAAVVADPWTGFWFAMAVVFKMVMALQHGQIAWVAAVSQD